MNTPESTILINIIVYGLSWLLVMRITNDVVRFLSKNLKNIFGEKLENYPRLMDWTKQLKNALFILFGFWIFCLFLSEGQKKYDKFMAGYKSPRQQRLEFLEAHCKQVDIEYEVLNNGKRIYQCPNGKEYKE